MFISFTYIVLVVDPMTEEGEQAAGRGGTQGEIDQQMHNVKILNKMNRFILNSCSFKNKQFFSV